MKNKDLRKEISKLEKAVKIRNKVWSSDIGQRIRNGILKGLAGVLIAGGLIGCGPQYEKEYGQRMKHKDEDIFFYRGPIDNHSNNEDSDETTKTLTIGYDDWIYTDFEGDKKTAEIIVTPFQRLYSPVKKNLTPEKLRKIAENGNTRLIKPEEAELYNKEYRELLTHIGRPDSLSGDSEHYFEYKK